MGQDSDTSVDDLRIALRFSLWAWAAYWPGGGLLLALGGLDWVSLGFAAIAVAVFVVVLASGALRPTASRNLRQFALERPLYLVAALVVLTVGSSVLGFAANVGLMLFSTTYLVGLGLVTWRAIQVAGARSNGTSLVASILRERVDQVLLTTALVGTFAALVFADAWLVLGDGQLGTSAPVVAAGSWVNLAYPVLLLVATRPFREPVSLKALVDRKPKAAKGAPAVADV